MRIQIFYFDDCPHYQPALELVRSAAVEMEFDADIELVYIDSAELANDHRFLGSPTVHVAGVDIDPAAQGRTDFGLSCRRYGSSGVPPRKMIVDALRRSNGGSE